MKDFKREGAYLAAAVERTPQSPRIDSGGRAIAAADNGSMVSCIHEWKLNDIPNENFVEGNRK